MALRSVDPDQNAPVALLIPVNDGKKPGQPRLPSPAKMLNKDKNPCPQ